MYGKKLKASCELFKFTETQINPACTNLMRQSYASEFCVILFTYNLQKESGKLS